MQHDTISTLAVPAVGRLHEGAWHAAAGGIGALPAGAPVRLDVAGLDPGVLERAGAAYTVEAVRGAVQVLVAAGHPVTLPWCLADAASTPDALLASVQELAGLSLRCPGRVAMDAAPPDDVAWHDPYVAAAVAVPLVTDAHHHTAMLPALERAWRAVHDASDDPVLRRQGEVLIRRVDDAARRAVFDMLRQAWLQRPDGWPLGPVPKDRALAIAEGVLGEHERWMKAFRQYTYDTVRRMVVIPTWQCELRCAYCFIPKQDGREMSRDTVERSVEMLLSTDEPEVALQFFGGEALLAWDTVQHALGYATRRADEVGKRIGFVLSSNGWSLTPERLEVLARYPVRLELSLDGDQRTQDRFRPSRWRGQGSYDHSIATHAQAILASGIEQYVIMVVHPTNVDAMPDNFFHIADMGFRHIQINNMLGRVWKPHELASFAKGLHTIGTELIRRWGRGEALEFINMRHRPLAMRLNGEVTIDHDGTVYGGNGFLHETEHKDKFVVGHLDELTSVDRYWVDATDNNFLLDWSYRPRITQNNIEVGKVMTSFIRWMGRQGYGPDGPRPASEREARTDARTAS
ncbi:MAG: radical SAM protein [Alphaproteobacteria bacterium]|nr:radical SAM protein [Alphaproteobacteria bacterium]